MLVGSAYWQGLLDWIHGVVLGEGKISAHDLTLLRVTDDPHEVRRLVVEHYERECGRKFGKTLPLKAPAAGDGHRER